MTASIPPWHVSTVDPDDDAKLEQIMAKRYAETGERPSKSGTLRRAVRYLWRREVLGDLD